MAPSLLYRHRRLLYRRTLGVARFLDLTHHLRVNLADSRVHGGKQIGVFGFACDLVMTQVTTTSA